MKLLRTVCMTLVASLALLGVQLSMIVAPIDVASATTPPAVDGLQTNGRVEPLGVAADGLTFGWHGESTQRGVVQTGYQVRVATTEADLASDPLWDSGEVLSDQQASVAYAGPALESATRYLWQVRTWDGGSTPTAWSDPASFETGLLSASDWQGDWITSDAAATPWTDYTVSSTFHLNEGAFGLYFRGADQSNNYMWQISVANSPALRVHTKINNNYSLLASVDLSGSFTKEQLLTGDHTVAVAVVGSTITTTLDGTQIDQRVDSSFSAGWVGLRSSGGESFVVRSMTVTAPDDHSLMSADFTAGDNPFDGGTLTPGGLSLGGGQEAWYSPSSALPLLRNDFDSDAGKTVSQARLYASALGVYDMSLNGHSVGDQHLAPGSVDFDKRVQSQTYDVTGLLNGGENVIGARLAPGWYSGRNAWLGSNLYGKGTALIAQLRIDYTDGTSQTVVSDSSWTTHPGPIVTADNLDGEKYDARKTQPGYDSAGFDASSWTPVSIRPDSDTYIGRLVPQPDEPVRTTQVLQAVSRTEVDPGVFVYDLGQNMVGVARVTVTGKAGDTITLRHAEVLDQSGHLWTANLRSAKATDKYTFAADGTITYQPSFTFHGFRYLEISGASSPPAVSDVTGQVWGSDLPATGSLSTSDPMLNQLVSNISWGQRGNFLSIPTDTPARDERLGWMGDINVFSPTAAYLRDTRAFMAKFSADMRDEQFADGGMPPVVPSFRDCCSHAGKGGAAWEDAVVTVPYSVFHAYGDTELVRANYETMKRFMDHVEESAGADLIDSDRDVFGDWASLGPGTPGAVIGTAYFAEDARMMSEMARAVGEQADADRYQQLSEDVRAAFADTFVADDGTVSTGTQTAYAMALGMNLVRPGQRAAVGKKFVARLHADDDHLQTGFVGTPWLLPALTSIGDDDLAYKLLLNKTYPSWGYEIEQGATTMWERWDSIGPDGTYGDPSMNSFNHYAYGAVGDWMFQNIGAISPLESGYKKVRIAPNLGGGLTHAEASFESIYGTIATDWSVTNGGLSLHVTVPVNTTAQVVVPAASEYAVLEGDGLAVDADGVTGASAENGRVTLTVGSGTYDFETTATSLQLGELIAQIERDSDHVDDLGTEGDLSPADAQQLTNRIGDVHDAAIAAARDSIDDAAAAAGDLSTALTAITGARSWLAASTVDAPTAGELDKRLQRLQAQTSRALSNALGIHVSLPPLTVAVARNSKVTANLSVTNSGNADLTDLAGNVSVDGWGTAAVSLPSLKAGASTQLPFSLTVPAHANPGETAASFDLTFARAGSTFTYADTTPAWATVDSGVSIGEVGFTATDADPAENATLAVEVTNTGSADLHDAVVAAQLPDGWKSVRSSPLDVAAGATVTAEVPVVVPTARVGGDVPVVVQVRSVGGVLASAKATPALGLPVPDGADVADHVDFGNAASEQAHDVQASPDSGTNEEAGLSRRYSTTNAGQYFSAEVDVPDGKPFVLRSRETFGGASNKRILVRVDGTPITTQIVPHKATSAGTEFHDVLVTDPAVIDGNGGQVRVQYELPPDSNGYTDPSVADLWVLPVGDDTRAPAVSAFATAGEEGDNGWYRSGVSVAVESADSRDADPVVETGTDNGWGPYSGPVAVTGDGKHTLSFRATDASGNRSNGVLPVWIDTTAPETTMAVVHRQSDSGQAGVSFNAQDALSGVAVTQYRIDGGSWHTADGVVEVEGYGSHTVDYASTDVAGNTEVVHGAVITVDDVDVISAADLPEVRGVARVGSRLTSTDGVWNTDGLMFTRQWLRDGRPIPGATGTTYVPRGADVGTRLSIRVTASKAGRSGVATSISTAKVVKAPSRTTLAVNKKHVPRGGRITITTHVIAPGVTPSGRVAVRVGGKVVRTVSLTGGGARVTFRIHARGTVKITVRYLGSASTAASTSPPRSVTVR